MKKVLFICCVLTAVVFSCINLSLSLQEHSNLITSLVHSLESLSNPNNTTPENRPLPDNYIRGYSMESVTIKDSFTVGGNVGVSGGAGGIGVSGGIDVGFTFRYIFCCVAAGNDATACNKSAENSDCSNRN